MAAMKLCLSKSTAIFLFLLAAILPLYAESSTESNGTAYQTSLNYVLATTLETKATLIETITMPFLAGSNPLTAGNNLQFKFAGELSPVSLNGTIDTLWTPIAFLQFSTGAAIGSGWNIPIANGLTYNVPSGNEGNLDDASFDGLVWSAKCGGTFQFDLAAILPGAWHHVVFQTYHEAKYRALTSAADNESWLYEADEGENRNGWNYYGSYFLGYQMPIILNMAGLLVETEKFLYNTDDSDSWGENYLRWKIGPVFNFAVTERLSLALILQMHTVRNYTNSTKDYFYQYRIIDTTDPLRFEFYRAALNLTLVLN